MNSFHFLLYRTPERLVDGYLPALQDLPSAEVEVVTQEEDLLLRYGVRRPDLVLVGLDVPFPQRAVARTLHHDPTARVLLVGSGAPPVETARVVAAGARGLLTDPVRGAFLRAPTLQHAGAGTGNRTQLTDREQQVLDGMSEGRSNREIGRRHHLSEDTIKVYARSLFRKLSVGDRAAAVAQGFRSGLLR